MRNNIVLIGMRGSGKSTIAKLLAEKVGKKSIDLDAYLVEKTGMTIPYMVKNYGWEYFRDKESEIAKEAGSLSNTVIAAGGGVILRKENVAVLGKKGVFIFLSAAIDTLLKRVGEDPNRPAMTIHKTQKEEMEHVLKERKHLYKQVADLVIETTKKEPEEIVKEILLLRHSREGPEARRPPA
ncbi:MAG: shikimate kinase [Patescibacteria group bacterium]